MNLSDFYIDSSNDQFSFSREHGSHFAKDIAGDFNPLHDEQAKKFCIPGDLLFSLSLAKLGVSKNMQFTFNGMVTEGVDLHFSEADSALVKVLDTAGKEYMTIERSGDAVQNSDFASLLAQSYVAFSGHTFPHVLVPLMAEKNVMINPARPLVIYQNMSIDLQRLDFKSVSLEITNTQLQVDGKRGKAVLQFCFKEGDEIVGHGEKVMVLSGLREFDQQVIDNLVAEYDVWKQAYIC
ncbi:MAG: DUF3581 family protein [Oceanospirillaceae bacterium]|nr:DUF3581 family protein [Oceanospirillaceae bacterium]